MSRIICLDYGDKNIGVALSCPSLITALGAGTIRRTDAESFKKPILSIREIIRNNDVGTIVLGFPKNMDGSLSPRSEKTIEFKERLHRNFKSLEIVLWDERLSSMASEKIMSNMGTKRERIKEIVDEAAAIYILQGYLDFLNKNK